MSLDGFEHALLFDGKGGAKELDYNQLLSYKKEDGLLWVHFDYSSTQAAKWLEEKSNIDELAIESLLIDETRPRTTILENSLLIALRGVNLNPNSDPEDMISIRLFVNEHIIVSTKKRNLLTTKDIVESLKKGDGPINTSEFLITLTDKLTSRMQDTIEDMEDNASELEERVLNNDCKNLRTQISEIRRQAISLRRYLSPQKEAMYVLYHNKIDWIDDHDKIVFREITDGLIRYIEELDTIKDKVALVQEELANTMNEQMNERMYLLSMISAIFLPLGFLTGLLGINVGGIPGSENPYSFSIFVVGLIIITGAQLLYFRKKRWI